MRCWDRGIAPTPPVAIASIPEDRPGPSSAVCDQEEEEPGAAPAPAAPARASSRRTRDREDEFLDLIREDIGLQRRGEDRRGWTGFVTLLKKESPKKTEKLSVKRLRSTRHTIIKMAFIKEESEDMKIEETFSVKQEETEEQTDIMPLKEESQELSDVKEEKYTALVTVEDRFSNMMLFFELYGFFYSINIMRSTEKKGKLDECCHRLEQRMDAIEDLKIEVKASEGFGLGPMIEGLIKRYRVAGVAPPEVDLTGLKKAKRVELEADRKPSSEADVLQCISHSELALHCRRTTRGTKETLALIESHIQAFDGDAGRDTLGVPLINSAQIR
ncbi:unnamed protein product [Leuciscus chuanchicus]